MLSDDYAQIKNSVMSIFDEYYICYSEVYPEVTPEDFDAKMNNIQDVDFIDPVLVNEKIMELNSYSDKEQMRDALTFAIERGVIYGTVALRFFENGDVPASFDAVIASRSVLSSVRAILYFHGDNSKAFNEKIRINNRNAGKMRQLKNSLEKDRAYRMLRECGNKWKTFVEAANYLSDPVKNLGRFEEFKVTHETLVRWISHMPDRESYVARAPKSNRGISRR